MKKVNKSGFILKNLNKKVLPIYPTCTIAECPYVKEVRCVEYCRGKGIPIFDWFDWRDNGKASFEYFDRNNKGAQLIISPSEELTSKDTHKQFLYGLAIYYWIQKEIKEKIEGLNSLSNLLT